MYELLLALVLVTNVLVDFLDRRSVRGGDYYALALWTTIIQFLLILPLIGLIQLLPLGAVAWCAAVGGFSALGRVPWYRALDTRSQSLSRLAPFAQLSSVIVLIGAYSILGEQISPSKLQGGLLIILGSILITMDSPWKSLRQFFQNNIAGALVLVFAISLASISILYKYLLNQNIDIFSIYFHLKLFQMASLVLLMFKNRRLIGSYDRILFLRLFVLGRSLQTLSALTFLIALRGLDLSYAEPLMALGPLIIFIVELSTGQFSADCYESRKARIRALSVQLLALLCVGTGLYVFYGGLS